MKMSSFLSEKTQQEMFMMFRAGLTRLAGLTDSKSRLCLVSPWLGRAGRQPAVAWPGAVSAASQHSQSDQESKYDQILAGRPGHRQCLPNYGKMLNVFI